MQKYLLLTILLFLQLGRIDAQNTSFRLSAPSVVESGENFRIVYTLNNGEGHNIKAASSIEGFDILYGPAISSSHSMQIINGKSTTSSSESYIYTVKALSEGTFTIPAATISVDGEVLKSNTVQVKVVQAEKKQDNRSQQQGQQAIGQQPEQSKTSSGQGVSATDAFIRTIVSKTKIREQEAFVVTFRFYTTLEVRDIGKIEFPEFEGFMVEDQNLQGPRQLGLEHYNGRNYYSTDLKRTLLFPQRSGEIIIPEGKLEMVFHVRSGKTVNTFFGPQYVMTDVKKTLKTSPLKIQVQKLPENKPLNFSNGVGTFTMKESITETKVKANDPITLTLTIAGVGNLKLLKTPEIALPKDFEKYDPKVTNDLKFTDSGLSGVKTIEYLFIPRYQGTYTIAPIEFSYFDTKSNSYKTLSTSEYNILVEKDPNATSGANATSFTQSEVKAEKDIRYLKTNKPDYFKINKFLFGSISYYLWYIIPFLMFVVFFIINRKKIKENADLKAMKIKYANKVAVKRLKQAQKHLIAHQKEKFYEEVLRAVWGYLSDKLVIPVAGLNRDNIEIELRSLGADNDLISQFIQILDTCEYARYAPAESNNAMDDLYQDTVDAIGKMENSKIKRN